MTWTDNNLATYCLQVNGIYGVREDSVFWSLSFFEGTAKAHKFGAVPILDWKEERKN